MSKPEEDRKLREKLKLRDVQFQSQLKEQMEKEEQNLQGYFKQFKKPVDKDPTKIKRSESAAVDRTLIFKQALRPLTLFSTFYEFWNMKCATTQQDYTLEVCKKNYIKNMTKGVVGSLLITSFVSFRLKTMLPPYLHVLGVFTALMSGFLYGSIKSTKFTLEEFQKLGEGFQLGRIASTQISKYRMDKPINAVPQRN